MPERDQTVRVPAGRRLALNVGDLTLSQLYVYPIKSCGSVALESAAVSATGLRHDRRWMLVDETGEFLSQRELPRMALISVRFAPQHLIVGAPGMPDLDVPLEPETGNLVDVRVWGHESRGAAVGEEADRWFGEFLELPCRLVYKPDGDVRAVDSLYAADGTSSMARLVPCASATPSRSRRDRPRRADGLTSSQPYGHPAYRGR